jgi:general L-amino acid transport system substrate-binding protein
MIDVADDVTTLVPGVIRGKYRAMNLLNLLKGVAPVVGLIAMAAPAAAQTLASVREHGAVNCGVSEGLYGFSVRDGTGKWSGLDVDFCRAIAAAIFDDAEKVRYTPLDVNDRFAALQSGRIDVLARNSTWTMSRETGLKLIFPVVTYYDGQGFLIRKSRNADSALELDGVKVCVQPGTTTEQNLTDYFANNNMKLEKVETATAADAVKAYDAGRCDVFTSDVSQLHAERLNLANPDDHIILPDVISKEPLSPAVRQGDETWAMIVKWTQFAMLNAEELGVSSKTLAAALKSGKPAIRRLVGTEGDMGEQLGLAKDWAARIVRHVGNYGEVFERNVGVGSRLGIPRGINQLWNDGGIQYAPPLQ